MGSVFGYSLTEVFNVQTNLRNQLICPVIMFNTLTFDLYLLLCFSLSLFFCSKVKNRNLYLATFASVLGPMSFGFVLGYSSPAIPELTRIADPHLRLNDVQASWFGVRREINIVYKKRQLFKFHALKRLNPPNEFIIK